MIFENNSDHAVKLLANQAIFCAHFATRTTETSQKRVSFRRFKIALCATPLQLCQSALSKVLRHDLINPNKVKTQ